MSPQEALQLAQLLARGEITPAEFLARAASDGPSGAAAGVVDTGSAHVDLDRRRRCGYPEVVFAQSKSAEALLKIISTLIKHGTDVLSTRVSEGQAQVLLEEHPTGRYNPIARTFRLSPEGYTPPPKCGHVVIVTAGTSDFAVADEARETCDWMGVETTLIQDVGVAGPHRLPLHLDKLDRADAVVVVAGMEGALPSVVGGYVAAPVFAVPTSVGYGASFGGVSALLGMLNSCASNVTVVNIDAGFKGGYVAGLVAQRIAKAREGAG